MATETVEQWRDVVGWEGLYSVSDAGRVRRDAPGVNAKPGQVLALAPIPGRYVLIGLSNKGRRVSRLVHRLVCEAFHGLAPDSLSQVNHLNGDKHDNRACNLEWCTASQNHRHSFDVLGQVGVNGSMHGRAKLTEADIPAIRADPRSQSAIASAYGVSQTCISKIKLGRKWKHV